MSDREIMIRRVMSAAVIVFIQNQNNGWVDHYSIWNYDHCSGHNYSEEKIISDREIIISRIMSAAVVITTQNENNRWVSHCNI